jgi:UDP-3-O-[3-hydroxymyristoyl] glucosamine N-acyltransferase
MQEQTLQELANLIGGEVIGNAGLTISGIASIEKAREGEITFIAQSKYLPRARETKASAIIAAQTIEAIDKPLILTDNPYLAYAKIATLFHRHPQPKRGIAENTIVGEETRIGKDVSIYPFVFIGKNVTIADGVIIYPHTFIGDGTCIDQETIIYSNVSLRERCRNGTRVIIHSGTVIGSDGFGFAPDGNRYYKIPQVGTVQIDDDVEIGANNTIDRGALGTTWLKRGVKTDNLVHIAHNVVVGEDTLLVAQVGISGSTTIGNHVTLAGQVGVVGHLEIGDNTIVGAKTGVSGSVPADAVVSGYPHMPHRQWLKSSRCYPLLPEMRKTLKHLEERMKRVEEMLDNHTGDKK